MPAVEVLASGMTTGVGLNAPAACAAIRCGITGFAETRFMFAGEWLMGCEVPLEQPWRGREKLLQMAVPSIRECLTGLPPGGDSEAALLLCVAETGRPGRLAGLDDGFLREVQGRLGREFHTESGVIAGGRVGGVRALARARELLGQGVAYCVVAGVDSYLVAPTLAALDTSRRIQTAENSDGCIPGEAGAAVLLAPAPGVTGVRCVGIGFGTEPAPIDSEEPVRADGLTEAIRKAFADSGLGYEQMAFRIADVSGGQYGFKETSLALLRTMRVRKEEFPIWHPADCVGEVGAAAVPLMLAVAVAAQRKGYAPGSGALCHVSGDDAQRAAFVLELGTGVSN